MVFTAFRYFACKTWNSILENIFISLPFISINHTKDKKKERNTLEIYDNLKTKPVLRENSLVSGMIADSYSC